jgi:hypothetical protein
MTDLKKSNGGYMSVDTGAALRHNRQTIERIRESVRQAQQQRESTNQPEHREEVPKK